MKRLVSTAIAGFVLVSCANAPLPSIAADNPNILILGEDADRDSVPRNSRVFRRVLDALSNQLNEQGFNVYDETAVTLDDFAQGRARRTDAEIIDIARLVKRPPIDVAVIFQIYASANQLAYTTKIKTRITGRLLNARTGQRFDSFEVESPAEWTGPRDCPRECLLEVVGGKARILANHLGAVLTEKLAYLAERGDTAVGRDGSGLRNAYNLVFDGFNERDINDIEEYLVVFSGYRTHRPSYSAPRRMEIWYESSIRSGRLNRNLKKMLDHLDLRGTVVFSGNTFTVKKVTFRKRRPINSRDW